MKKLSAVHGTSGAALAAHSPLVRILTLVAAGLGQAGIPPPLWAEAGKTLLHLAYKLIKSSQGTAVPEQLLGGIPVSWAECGPSALTGSRQQ